MAKDQYCLYLGLVPYVGWVLGIIGVILLLRGLKELANYYQDNQIYENSLTGVKFYIVALIAAAVAITAIVIGVGTATGFKFNSSFTLTAGFGIGLAIFFGGIIIAFIFYVLAAIHLRQTFNTLAQKTGEHSFATTSTLLWWGSILTIIGVGLILIFIAWIFAVIGFFAMRSTAATNCFTAKQLHSTPCTTCNSTTNRTILLKLRRTITHQMPLIVLTAENNWHLKNPLFFSLDVCSCIICSRMRFTLLIIHLFTHKVTSDLLKINEIKTTKA